MAGIADKTHHFDQRCLERGIDTTCPVTLRHERGGLHTYNHQNHITGRHYVKDADGNIYRVTETSLWEESGDGDG